jgi:Uma2 family endonuclease
MSQTLAGQLRWTTADLDLLSADEWKRYEIIDGELFVTRAPHRNICSRLQEWSEISQLGEAVPTPGLIFNEADNVIPDVIWISHERLAQCMDEAGHLTGAPELVVEILSPGSTNERRDREAKLKLYSTQGVQEYWIVSRELQQIEVFRRENAVLKRAATFLASDTVTSPLLPGFAALVTAFFS